MLYPLRFTPLYFEKVWGGRRLESLLGRQLPPNEPIGESWEVSDHPHGKSVVANGTEKGKTLHELIKQYGASLLGTRVARESQDKFPLLIKYIDASDKLSVQVHPNDAYAEKHEGELGKTEMWYILHAEPNSCLIVGLNEGVTAEQFHEALQHGDPSALLYHMPVKTGDSIFIPSGRIHAIMPGLVILEIQQNSDTTYRLYDWGRVGLDGKPRTLHIKQAMDVSNWSDYTPKPSISQSEADKALGKTVLATCDYFVVEKYELDSPKEFITDGGSFYILNCVAGDGKLVWDGGEEALTYGDTLLIPASITKFSLQPNDSSSYVLSYVP
ncbi:MAG TPA: type I phosphomannose isomerase catalytic subunit [Armatimonadota bacterium]|nr:type I phosphomannose isomerase catalytic subunit [Armatimonadota bacterium]